MMAHKLSVNTDITFHWRQLRQLGAGAFGTVSCYIVLIECEEILSYIYFFTMYCPILNNSNLNKN